MEHVDSAAGSYREAGITLEALLLAPMLRPMVTGIDAIGDYGLDLVARSIAERDAGDATGFAASIAAALEARR